jgi:hypothetical protein
MMDNDSRTEEQADEDWRRVTDSIFGANTGAAPKVVEWKGETHKPFVPDWSNHVTQELRDEEKRWADEWSTRSRADQRRAVDKQRDGGGSPMRGNRNLKPTLLDEIDDPHGDYIRARATGYENPLVSPGWEDVGRHDEEVNQLLSTYTHPERASSSSASRPKSFITLMNESSSKSPPVETNEKGHTCKHGVKTKKLQKRQEE